MSKKFTPPIFPSVENIGQKFLDPEFFKKQTKIKKEDFLSFDQRRNVFRNVKAYNTFYGTHFFVEYQPVGESSSYQLKEIRNKSNAEMLGIFKNTPKSATFVEMIKAESKKFQQGIQRLLFSIDEFTVQKPPKFKPGKENFKDVRFSNH